MILYIRIVMVLCLFMNFSMSANKLDIGFIYKIFMEIKGIRVLFVKLIGLLVLLLFINYNRYIYYRVGLRIEYGRVFVCAFLLVLIGWTVWAFNNGFAMLRHFLPVGIGGVLKMFIPVLEVIGVVIRPLTLAVRLATNIRCGHVVLLMFRFFAFNTANYLVLSIRVVLFGLYFIEFLVCVIQAYVFRRLLYIYMIEIEI